MWLKDIILARGIKGKTARNAVLITGAWIVVLTLLIVAALAFALMQSLSNSTKQQAARVESIIADGSLTRNITSTEPGSTIEVIDGSGNIIASSEQIDQQELPKPLLIMVPQITVPPVETPPPPPEPAPSVAPSPAPPPIYDDDDYDDDDDDDYDDDDYDDDDDPEVSWRDQGIFNVNPLNYFSVPYAFAAQQDPQSSESSTDNKESVSMFEPLIPGETDLSYSNDPRAGSHGPYVIYREGVATPEGGVTVVSKTSLAPAFESAKTLGLVLLGMFPFTLLAIAYTVNRITEQALQPVDRLVDETRQISIGNLDRRLSIPQHDRELEKLALTVNDLLDDLQESIAQRQQFVSDASHELKSPIASIAMILDVVDRDPEMLRHGSFLDDLHYEVDRLTGIIADLVILAKGEELTALEEKRSAFVPIDLYDLVKREVAALEARGSHPIITAEVEPVVMYGDATSLSRLVRNLLDNADRFTATNIWISLKAINDDEDVVMRISDDGPGVPLEDRTRVFERFVRLDPSRDRKMGGTGLGLPVVKTIAALHGGEVVIEEAPMGGAQFVVTLNADSR